MRKAIGFVIFLFLLSVVPYIYPNSGKAAMVIASKDFRDEELLIPKSMIEKAGYEVIVFSDSIGKAKGMLGSEVKINKTISALNPKEYDAVLFIGGSGSKIFWDDKIAHKIAVDTVADNKILGAICFAGVTLAKSGVLAGKNATVSPYVKGQITEYGANYTGQKLEVDGNIITADGPDSAGMFGEAILKTISAGRRN